MGKSLVMLLLFILMKLAQLSGQNALILEHKSNNNRIKTLDTEREYFLHTKDTMYFSTIISYTDSTISVYGKMKPIKDTTFISSLELYKVDDAIYKVMYPPIVVDTIIIPFSEIIIIKKYWFKNQRWLEGFAWMSLGIVMALPLLPLAAIDNGWEGVMDWAIFEAYLIGICVPPMFIGTRKSNFNLTDTWTLKTMNVQD